MNETQAAGTEYQGYSADPKSTDDQIREWFKRKFGYYPHAIYRSAGAILAGPIFKTRLERFTL